MKSLFIWFTVLSLTFATTGCSSLNLLKLGDQIPTATAKNPALRCLCLWQEGEGQGVDGRPARGFAGQVFFFKRNERRPVKVEGDVRIFLFDDVGEQNDQAKPLHQFDFVDESWNTHLYMSQFGPVYRIFVPYTRKGMNTVNAALRVRLTPKNRSPLFSDLTPVKLAGQDNENEAKLGQLPEFHDRRILLRNGAVKITRSEDRPESLDEYLQKNSRTLGTNEQGRMARDSSFASRVNHTKHEAADRRVETLERQLAEMLERERQRNCIDRSRFDQQAQTPGTYREPELFPQDGLGRPDNGQPMDYDQALEQYRQLSRAP